MMRRAVLLWCCLSLVLSPVLCWSDSSAGASSSDRLAVPSPTPETSLMKWQQLSGLLRRVRDQLKERQQTLLLQLSDLQSELSASQEEYDQLKSRHTKLLEQLADLETDSSELRVERDQLSSQLQDLQSRLTSLRSLLTQLRKSEQRLTELFQEAEAQLRRERWLWLGVVVLALVTGGAVGAVVF